MYELEISSSTENYFVSLGINYKDIINQYDALVIDTCFQGKIESLKPVMWIDATEANKNLSTVENICHFFSDALLNRKSRILAIGGGVIQDLSTLAASIYMRGIAWDYLPTTLTGMMDSCLGGKSSINVGSVKNLVGNIYPPSHIYVDTSFASTLDSQSISSGLAEGVKIVFARGDTFFDDFVGNPASQNPHDQNHLLELIYLTLSSKKWFIEIDEFDKAERQLLNFGHSFGHAYEAACDFTIQHGLGVAIGVLAALNHPAATHNRSTESLSEYCLQLARKHSEILRDSLNRVNWNTFEKSLRSDKKNTSDSLVLILPSEDQLSRIQLPYADKSLQIATKTMQDVLKSIVSESE